MMAAGAPTAPVVGHKYAVSHPEFYPLDDMYYTLDLDFEDWEHEKNKKKQSEAKSDPRGTPTPEEDEKKKKTKNSAASSRELRSLLADVKTKKRGGHPTYVYEGQEELTEALESVLTKIKDYSDHSYPFLNKVRASDAPDYYEVIKRPMDLGLMTKKLKRGEYSSKSEFQADLNLIFSNCRIYNTDPSSKIYLEHADFLEKKSVNLMKQVKNIDYSKERKLREANPNSSPIPLIDDEESHKHLHNSTDGSNSNNSTPTSNYKSKQKSPDKERDKFNLSPMSPIKIEMPDLDNETIQSKTDLYRCLTRQYRLQKLAHIREQDSLPFGERAALVRDADKMTKFMALNGYPGLSKKDALSHPIRTESHSTTTTTTTTTTTSTDESITTSTSTSSSTPPIAESSSPTTTSTSTDPANSTTTENNKPDEAEKGDSAEDTITREVGFFPELCFFVDSVPELYPCISSEDDKAEDAVKKEEDEGSSSTTANGNGGEAVSYPFSNLLIKKEEQEDEEMAQAPQLETNKTPTPPLSPSQPPRTPSTPTLNPTPSVVHPPPSTTPTLAVPMHCSEYYNALLRKTIAVVLSKSGFITIGSSQVMDVLTDIVNGYMLRLGKLLKTHIDDIGAQAPFEEVFSRVLCEMGIAGISDIRDFVVNMGAPRENDTTGLEYDPRNSIYNRSVGVDYDYDDENDDEEEAASAQPENSSGRTRRNVTKISERDNMYEYYEEETPADAGGAGSTPSYNAANNSKVKQPPKKPVPKKPVKPATPNKKRAKNLPPNPVSKKKK